MLLRIRKMYKTFAPLSRENRGMRDCYQTKTDSYELVASHLFSVTSEKSLCLHFLICKVGVKILMHYLLSAVLKFKEL